MKYSDLMLRAAALVHDPSEPNMENVLQTLASMEEPEDDLDAALRRMIVDAAVAEYLGKCRCLDKEEG